MAQPGTFVDLLTEPAQENAEDKLYELANTISNIVSSYDDPYDAFAELVQNALDAVAARAATDDHFTPRVTVAIDLAARTLAVEDNGTGIRWDDHRPAVRPNYSLKRRLGQRSSRGEKGAALTFLQFGHSMFELTTRAAGEFGWTYRLHDGKSWYERTAAHLEDPSGSGSYEQPTFDLTQHGTGDVAEQGTIASVTFPDDRLVDLIGEDLTCAGDRIEYLLRTRTGIGFMIPDGDRDNLQSWQRRLEASIRLNSNEFPLQTGFLFPHELAKRSGSRKSALLTTATLNNELLYEYFDEAWIKKYLKTTANKKHLEAIKRFELNGYVAYAHRNNWYEEVTQRHLGLPEDADDGALAETLLQVNGGFLIAVRDFPTGRRKSFLHRSGAEHKSRTFVFINLSGDYKPDYGRKNLGAQAHSLVLDLCKDLIAFAASKSSRLYRGSAQSTHSASQKSEAEEVLKQDAARLRERGILVASGEPKLRRSPATETEVVAEFLKLVAMDLLPGFSVYGFLARGILDGFFDYQLNVSDERAFDAEKEPLGVAFAESQPKKYDGQWMEFKVTSDSLTDDFKKKPGEQSKKYFGLVHLLVCETVDTATDDFEIIEITEENYDQRKYFGVTHLLRSAHSSEDQVQVISLRTFREALSRQGVRGVDLTPVPPVEEG